ncbi:toll/interleukin-1 receptor domain-containing protein [Pontiellaceae bacterium B12227]|nr:toll/interleukin-1 receptor domain-containing protein [Pontiellaceae bacterium B12227]
MSDIFVTYAREDQERVKELVSIFDQRGWSVFWDRRIPAGETWRGYIGKALDESLCVVVLWSESSVTSPWVAEEADDGKQRGVLVPVMLDPVKQPRGFREIQAADLTEWQPGHPSSRLDELCNDIHRMIGGSAMEPREVPKDYTTAPNVAVSQAPFQSAGGPLEPHTLERPVNLGFDGPVVDGMPNGWFNSEGHVSYVSTRYDFRVDRREDGVPGSYAAMGLNHATEGEFGSLMQRIDARHLAGKAMRFEADLRGVNLAGWAGLWLRADGEQESDLLFDNMHNRSIRGTTQWTRYCLTVSLPPETVWLNYGLVLSGAGQLWADDCRLLKWSSTGEWEDV